MKMRVACATVAEPLASTILSSDAVLLAWQECQLLTCLWVVSRISCQNE